MPRPAEIWLKHTLTSITTLAATVVIFLKATTGKSQNRISLKHQFLKNDKSESFRFSSSLQMFV